METVNDKIISKVSKLVAVGKCAGASEQERETAMRQAYALLTKHNLSMESLDEDKNPRERQDEEGHGMVWARQIANAIAELFFCKYAYAPSRVNRCYHVFIGKRSNVAVAKELSKYIIDSVFSESGKRMRKEGGERPSVWRMSFCKGAAYALHNRCLKMRREKEQELNGLSAEAGTSLVLADHYKIESEKNTEWMSSKMATKTSVRKARQANRADAFYSGKEYGENVNLSNGMIDKK